MIYLILLIVLLTVLAMFEIVIKSKSDRQFIKWIWVILLLPGLGALVYIFLKNRIAITKKQKNKSRYFC